MYVALFTFRVDKSVYEEMENKWYPLFSNWFSNTYHIGKHSQESISRNQNMNILAPVSTLIHFFIIFPFRLHSFFLCVLLTSVIYD